MGLAYGCQGVSESDLFAKGDASSNPASPAKDGSVIAEDGGVVVIEEDGSVPIDDGGVPSGNDAQVSTDATTDASGDAGDGGDGGPVRTIECGTADCVVGSQVCCRLGIGDATTFECRAPGACSGLLPPTLSIPCDDADDCTALGTPGVCCVEASNPIQNNLSVSNVSCKTIQNCAPAFSHTVACDPNAPTATACPLPSQSSLRCKTTGSRRFPYNVCR